MDYFNIETINEDDIRDECIPKLTLKVKSNLNEKPKKVKKADHVEDKKIKENDGKEVNY